MTDTQKNDDQDAGPPGNGITTPLSGQEGYQEGAGEDTGGGESDDDHHDDPVTGIGPEDPS
ncbi:hypothetical protein ABIE44_001487 [Marmoricola sp. OAE513]|uniref:hypothetical protein n=1 Tax=Marmoricola sp. OAE513 TaxID=2817894 RepID=UPI001AE2E96B